MYRRPTDFGVKTPAKVLEYCVLIKNNLWSRCNQNKKYKHEGVKGYVIYHGNETIGFFY
jgi:hypothetical protein